MPQSQKPNSQQENQWHQDPKNWFGGLFYYNKQDKRLFPPKRFKQMGFTINFANPKSVFALVLILAGAAFVIFLVSSNGEIKRF